MAHLVSNGVSRGWQDFSPEGGDKPSLIIGDNGSGTTGGVIVQLQARYRQPNLPGGWSGPHNLGDGGDPVSLDILSATRAEMTIGCLIADQIQAVLPGGDAYGSGLEVWTKSSN